MNAAELRRRPRCLLAAAAISLLWLPSIAGDPVHPRGHRLEGLPVSLAPMPLWDDDADHWLNRLHAALFLVETAPREIGAALPAERKGAGEDDAGFFQPKWYFRKREGGEADRAVFGGDVRFSPVAAADAARGTELRELLAAVQTAEQVADLPELADPLRRAMVQWDVLQLWWRWTRDAAAEPATLASMARAVRALAQDADRLRDLPPGMAGDDAPDLLAGLLDPDSAWVEVDREERALFAAPRSIRAARVFLRAADGQRASAEALVQAAGADAAAPSIAIGTRVALVLSMVCIDTELRPVATPVIDEVRVREITGPAELRPDNGDSRDGISHRVFLRSRERVRRGLPPFREIAPTAQALFLEYGTPKHTTYFAQCALCHRQTNSGGQSPAGINALGRFAKPRVCRDPATRLRLAETQFAAAAAALAAALAD